MSWIRVSCHVANEESSHDAECLLFILIPKNVQSNSVPKLVVARNVLLHGNPARFWFLAESGNDAFDDGQSFRRNKSFCVSTDGSKFNPINTQASLLFTVARWFTLINEKFDLED